MENMNQNLSRPLSFGEREQQCKDLFFSRGPYYHLCTPGDCQLVLFETDDDFRFAMNLMASSTYSEPDVNVITFEAMRTHLHLIGEGPVSAAEEWFSKLRKRLYRFYQSTGRVRNLDSFQASVFPIDDLSFLRNSIAYVNRNGYRRQLFGSHSVDYAGEAPIVDGYISPAFFCDLKLGEGVFRDARHYFSLVSRSVEAYKDIANLLGDSIYYTDDELYLIVRQICRDRYGNARPEILTLEQKMELARTLRFEYKSSDRQIQRMLHLDERRLLALFGK